MIAYVGQADLTADADAWRLGVPRRVGTVESEHSGAVLVRQADEAPVTYFPARELAGGVKWVRDRIMRLGGTFSVPHGPALTHARTRVPQRTPAPGPRPNAVAVTRMPAGLTPTQPWWESTQFGADGYLAP